MQEYVTENRLADVLEKIFDRLDGIDQRMGRLERNQKYMIETLNEFRDAYREQQVQNTD